MLCALFFALCALRISSFLVRSVNLAVTETGLPLFIARIPFQWVIENFTSTPSVCFIVIGLAVARSSFGVKGKL